MMMEEETNGKGGGKLAREGAGRADKEVITRSREDTRRAYDRMSRFYGLLSSGSEKRFVEIAVNRYLRPRRGERILEVGFGAGRALVAMAGMVGEEGRVCGIDLSDGMVKAARRRLDRAGLANRAEPIRGDAAAMPYGDACFDGAFMSFTLELFEASEIPTVLAECLRVLRPGGRLCVASMSDRGRHGMMMRLYLGAHRRFPGLVDCRPIPARRCVEEAGFRVESGEVMSMWGLPVEIVLGMKAT